MTMKVHNLLRRKKPIPAPWLSLGMIGCMENMNTPAESVQVHLCFMWRRSTWAASRQKCWRHQFCRAVLQGAMWQRDGEPG